MNKQYTKRQILESIKYWQKLLNESADLDYVRSALVDMVVPLNTPKTDNEDDVVIDNYMDLVDKIINGRAYESAKAMLTLGEWLNDSKYDRDKAVAVMDTVLYALKNR